MPARAVQRGTATGNMAMRAVGVYRGGGVGRGSYPGHGAGLGNFLSSLWRGLAPLFRRGIKVAAKSAVKAAKSKTGQSVIKSVKKSAKRAALKGASRAFAGENVLEGAKTDLAHAKRDIGKTLDKAADSANGNGPDLADNKKKKKKAKSGDIKVKAVKQVTLPTRRGRKKIGGGKSLI